MYIVKQKGFDEFHCIAAQCPESCCKFWQIVPDPDSIARYRTLGETDVRVQTNVNEKEEVFRQNGRICGFLDPDELCYLQKTYGEQALCDTCRNYPRHMEEFENVREYTLSLSCPEAVREYLMEPEPFGFVEEETDEDEEWEDFDCLFYDQLLEAREHLLSIAAARSVPLDLRMRQIEECGFRMQQLFDEDRLFELNDVFTGLKNLSLPEKDTAEEKRTFSVLFELETLHSDWLSGLDQVWTVFYSGTGNRETEEQFSSFLERFSAAGEKLLALFLYTYFCGAVYDGWILSKVQLSLYSVKWIFQTAFCAGADEEALIRATYRFAREIEHSDLNLDRLEEWFQDLARD